MRPPLDLRLYLVLDPDLCGGAAGMVSTALAAVAGGATVVQLRAPRWKKREWVEAGRALKAALDPLSVPLIVNDHADVALAINAAGVHVGQDDLHPQAARELIGPARWLGLSIANAQQLQAVNASRDLRAGLDYLGVGPVFATGTKPDAAPVIGLAAFAELLRETPLPVVAIGGIVAGTIAQLVAAGADGVAVISAVCGQPDVEAAARALRAEGWPG